MTSKLPFDPDKLHQSESNYGVLKTKPHQFESIVNFSNHLSTSLGISYDAAYFIVVKTIIAWQQEYQIFHEQILSFNDSERVYHQRKLMDHGRKIVEAMLNNPSAEDLGFVDKLIDQLLVKHLEDLKQLGS